MEITKANKISIIYQNERKKLFLENKDSLLVLKNKKETKEILDCILGKKEDTRILYNGKEVNTFYPKEFEEAKTTITLIDNNENKFINKKKNILSQLKTQVKESTNLKKNLYKFFVTHQQELVKETKRRRKEKIQQLCKNEILTVNEGITKYKKILKEEKNRLVINKLEARNEFIAEKARLQVKLKTNNIKKEIKFNSSQIKEEIEKVSKEIKLKDLSILNKTYEECSNEEKKKINLLFSFCGKKEVLILNTNKYDVEEIKTISKLIKEKEMVLIYITDDKVEKTYFNKELEF